MQEWFSYLAGTALKTSAVLAMAWAVAGFLRKRSAAVRHVVWTAAAAAVLALPFLSLELPTLNVPAAARLTALAPNITFQADAAAAVDRGTATSVASAPRHVVARFWWRRDWRFFVVSLWALVAIAGLAQMLVAAVAVWRMRRRARMHPAVSESTAWARGLGIGHTVEILEGPSGSMPMTCGLWRPAVFLPASAGEWTEERRRMVVLHELAHVRRGDVATHLLARTALCLYWWNPLAWMAWREFLKERERAADDLVLLSGARASEYATHLLEVARGMRPVRPVCSAAVAMARRSQLEGRLLAILDSGLNRTSVARVSGVAAALLAVVLVAPFAAMRAQDPSAVPPADVDATIRAALAQKNHEILEQAAVSFERLRQFDKAQKLLDSALAIREQDAGQNSVEYGLGLAKLGDLERARRELDAAAAFYTRAAQAIGNQPEAARPLTSLGIMLYQRHEYAAALDRFRQAQMADPAHSAMAFTWMALTYAKQEGGAADAETMFHQAMAVAPLNSGDAAVAADFYARFLKDQGRETEAENMQQQATAIRKAMGEAVKAHATATPGVYRVGGGVTAPMMVHKQEPAYTEEARAAKYQGTVVLYVEIGPDGLAHNIQVKQGLGMGLDEEAVAAVSQWRFKPGTRGGEPVTVAAMIEVNFRLL